MFFFTRFVALSCLFSVGVALLLDIGLILAAHLNGSVGVMYSLRGWIILWGLVWLGSFLLTWRILVVPILERAS